ncbi:MAG TPA: hypothetical protein VM286_01870 [Candidatus Thermoplasmatota archaeon]|nr:hypothetical protein [Candidatus Thermoplasmatota archaeon]
MRCNGCNASLVQVARRAWACPDCGSEVRAIDRAEALNAMRDWLAIHPLRDIPNSRDAPMFVVDGPATKAVLEWSKKHPGKPVPKKMLDKTRVSEQQIELDVFALLVETKLLRKRPNLAWAFFRTGFFVGAEGFGAMRVENRAEYLAAVDEWAAMPKELQRAFLKGIEQKVKANSSLS